MSTIAIIPIPGIAQIRPGDDLPSLLLDAIDRAKVGLKSGDILVLCQKIVSKAEGADVDLKTVETSPFARQIATMWEKDPRVVEVVLRESNRIIRMKNGVVITETKQGCVCANAGVDESNSLGDDIAIVLPKDPDASARTIRVAIQERRHVTIGVIIPTRLAGPGATAWLSLPLGCQPLSRYSISVAPRTCKAANCTTRWSRWPMN